MSDTEKQSLRLNCDLGESFGPWQMGDDDRIMPFVDMASVACGFHAGDPLVIQRAIRFSKVHGVGLGAHPAYPDLQGFGRRSMQLSRSELIAMLHYQVAALDGMAACQDVSLQYIKPHGALYNDMMRDEAILLSVLQAVADYHRPLPLVVQATEQWQHHQSLAQPLGVMLWFEAFADRRYGDDGRLLPRHQPGAVLGIEQMLGQVQQLMTTQTITSLSGRTLHVKADTLCVHGDNDDAIAGVKAIRELLASS
ncbi:5-oxoprolinase subunit PxpA [Aestuariibacter halophilus]|uniref:5-oxoprolinase subunit PxpA n=1 Tax=Fluctibacter halophilus TaxID=226011 RepID=A0ABS8G4D7_9ALTE|nr:5-oxoprolinase subunit PxpA [Aestuariibacter halophilus]MCC2615364.1 5-oxoprolinase subunit PxpA [Aestuariibacter halophilus]